MMSFRQHNYSPLKGPVHQPPSTFSRERTKDILQEELEKIRKWNVTTEMNMKKSASKIQNLTKTVEAQRKSLIDIQMDFESTSAQLHTEIMKRKTCQQKMNCTREMCHLLKTQTTELESTLSSCQNFQGVVEEQHHELRGKLEILTSKVPQLQDENQNFIEKTSKEVSEIRENSSQKMKEKDGQVAKLEMDKTQLLENLEVKESILREVREESQSAQQSLKSELQSVTEQCQILSVAVQQLKAKCGKLSEEEQILREKLQNSHDELQRNMAEYESERQLKATSIVDLKKQCITSEAAIDTLSSELVQLRLEKKISSERVESLEASLRKHNAEERKDKFVHFNLLIKFIATVDQAAKWKDSPQNKLKCQTLEDRIQNLQSKTKLLITHSKDLQNQLAASKDKFETLQQKEVATMATITTVQKKLRENEEQITGLNTKIALDSELQADLQSKAAQQSEQISLLEQKLKESETNLQAQTNTANVYTSFYKEKVSDNETLQTKLRQVESDRELAKNKLQEAEEAQTMFKEKNRAHEEELSTLKIQLEKTQQELKLANEQKTVKPPVCQKVAPKQSRTPNPRELRKQLAEQYNTPKQTFSVLSPKRSFKRSVKLQPQMVLSPIASKKRLLADNSNPSSLEYDMPRFSTPKVTDMSFSKDGCLRASFPTMTNPRSKHGFATLVMPNHKEAAIQQVLTPKEKKKSLSAKIRKRKVSKAKQDVPSKPWYDDGEDVYGFFG